MKKRNLILLFSTVSLFTISILSAQVQYSLKVGVNRTNFVSRASVDIAAKYNFAPMATWHFGMISNVYLSDKLSIQPELLFTQKGGEAPLDWNPIPSSEDVFKYRLSYVSIPVLIEYKLRGLSIEAGPEIALLMDEKLLKNGINTHTPISIVENKLDVSIDLGLKMTFGHFFSQVRWQRSIIPIGMFAFTDVNGEPVLNEPYYPTTLQLSLGYQL